MASDILCPAIMKSGGLVKMIVLNPLLSAFMLEAGQHRASISTKDMQLWPKDMLKARVCAEAVLYWVQVTTC